MTREGTRKPKSWARRLNVFVGLFVSSVCLLWMFYAVDRSEVFGTVRQVRLDSIVFAVIATFVSYVFRSLRWPWFFKFSPPNFRSSFRCLILGFFMNNVLPARIGELVRAHLGGRATKQSRTYVLATVAAERLVDGITISALFALLFTLAATPLEHEHGEEIFFVAYAFGAAAIVTAITLLFRHRLFRWLEQLGETLPGHLSTYTLTRILRFIEGLEPLFNPRRLMGIAGWSVAIWSIELFVYELVSKAYGVNLSLGALALFLAAVNFSSLIPAAPGGIGVIEFFAVLALQQIGVEREPAFVMVATQHLIQILVVGFPGLLYTAFGIGERLTPQDDELENGIGEAVSTPPRGGDGATSCATSNNVVEQDHIMKGREGNEVYATIVLPAFNEEHRLPPTLLSILDYIGSRSERFEVVVVDDGSTDGTAEVVRGFQKLNPNVRLIRYEKNRGKGYAVRTGMLSATGEYVLYNDADGSTPIVEIERLEEAIRSGAHVAIGSRAMFSRETAVTTVWYRKFLGRIFNAAVNVLVLPGIADTQCGFKLFERHASQFIFSRQRAERFSFDVEVLYIARSAGYRIEEVPVNWSNVAGSKINLLTDSVQMLLDVFRVRARAMVGGYRYPRVGRESVVSEMGK